MSKHLSRRVRTFVLPVVADASLLIAGCGSDDDEPVPPPAPDPTVTRTGSVQVIGAVKNAVVCLDLDSNGACGAGEPVSARTGDDGAYTLSYARSAVSEAQEERASLIASMTAGTTVTDTTSVDMSDPASPLTERDFALKQVAGKSGQINPLTTMVAVGMAAGMSETTARTNVAVQLGIAESKIDDYAADPPVSDSAVEDSARTMAAVVADALESGVALDVREQNAEVTAEPWDLLMLRYVDDANWSYRSLTLQAKPAGIPQASLIDGRETRTAGVTTPGPYVLAYLNDGGWRRCDATVPITGTSGQPSRSVFCGALDQAVWRDSTDVSGRSMAEVVEALQGSPSNTINVNTSTAALTAALGTAQFPANSALRPGRLFGLTRPWFISNINGNLDRIAQATATTLEGLIAARPASAVVLPSPAGTLSLNLGATSAKNIRVAFSSTTSPTDGTVQYYECDLNAAQTVVSNCAATGTGAYAIRTVSGVRVLTFGDVPASSASSVERAYAEVRADRQLNPVTGPGDWVYRVSRQKPGLSASSSESTRLNGTAWTAMRTQLGI